MSKITNVVLGVIGAVIGWVVSAGNPYGAWIGFSIGMGLGSIIDPMMPDMPAPGEPMNELEVMTNIEGIPLPDVLGTTKMTGNLLWYSNNHRHEVLQSEQGASTPDAPDPVTGYKHFLTWAMGFCLGPVDTLYTVYYDDDVVWNGNLSLADAIDGEASIILVLGDRSDLSDFEDHDTGQQDDSKLSDFEDQIVNSPREETAQYIGIMTFYFGTSNQPINAQLTQEMIDEGAIDDSSWALAYRNQCYAYMHNCYIGRYNRAPSIKIVIRKAPTCSFDP